MANPLTAVSVVLDETIEGKTIVDVSELSRVVEVSVKAPLVTKRVDRGNITRT